MSPIANLQDVEVRVDDAGHVWVKTKEGKVTRMLYDRLLNEPVTREAALELEAAVAATVDVPPDEETDLSKLRVQAASRRLMLDMQKLSRQERWLDELRDATDGLRAADQQLDQSVGLAVVLSIASQAMEDEKKTGRRGTRMSLPTRGES